MTERQKEIIRAALIYAQANIDDVLDAFAHIGTEEDLDNERGLLSVNGDLMDSFSEKEIEKIIMEMQ